MASSGVNVFFPLPALWLLNYLLSQLTLSFPHRTIANFLSQVLRYTALFAGLLYGITHQRTLNLIAASNQVKREHQHEESLIQQAKAEFAKRSQPATGNGGTCFFFAVDAFWFNALDWEIIPSILREST